MKRILGVVMMVWGCGAVDARAQGSQVPTMKALEPFETRPPIASASDTLRHSGSYDLPADRSVGPAAMGLGMLFNTSASRPPCPRDFTVCSSLDSDR